MSAVDPSVRDGEMGRSPGCSSGVSSLSLISKIWSHEKTYFKQQERWRLKGTILHCVLRFKRSPDYTGTHTCTHTRAHARARGVGVEAKSLLKEGCGTLSLTPSLHLHSHSDLGTSQAHSRPEVTPR